MNEDNLPVAAPTDIELARRAQDRMVFWTVTASIVTIVCNIGVLAITVIIVL